MNIILLILSASLPVLVLYWIFPRYQSLLISLSGILLLAIHSPISILPLALTSILQYILITKVTNKRSSTILSIVIIVIVLASYKIAEAVNVWSIAFVGLSYYSFKQIHLAIENYKGTLPIFGFSEYTGFLFFAPTFVVGPINKFNEFIKDYNRLRWNPDLFSYGLERIVYGLVKVSFMANYLVNTKLNELIYYLNSSGSLKAALYTDIFAFVANSYLQFSGFSDVAIGLSALFGFRIIENFNYPFLARNISDFWNRWHISLSNWCMNYVFYPLLAKSRNALISILITMIVLGLWHEISMKYIVWASFQAGAIFIWNRYKKTTLHAWLNRYIANKYLGIIITLHFVMFSFYVLKEESVLDYMRAIKSLLIP
ncbi:MBOAT family O-acyltransferase [Ekhidna sp.]|uniref:MBOAT family O-acyltransferase n=1 Tax=Ekhidna sp. TaxID=2608089 RepID=UPI003299B326